MQKWPHKPSQAVLIVAVHLRSLIPSE
ncbi:hypothetical protein CCACVL1_20989 [Corchorus capsularis]|uniref:Uncharacterized protein n=1 Tax=Corchorus capsularis TaxID=210143 RepID=A0A1R3H8X6_COCAP|nr:hypothetical protein CCACVL1_20989 [Corchorus capsularis]